MYIKLNKENKVIEMCSNKINDNFIFTQESDFDFRNYDYYLKNNKIEKFEREKEDFSKLSRICFLQTKLSELSQDFVQVGLGAQFDDIEKRKSDFINYHNELRLLLGKEKREYIIG